MSVLTRKDEIQVSENGKMSLPGTRTRKSENKIRKPKVAKEYTGIRSRFQSSGDTLSKVIQGLESIRDSIKSQGISSDYKISSYKNQLRFTFAKVKGQKFVDGMTEDEYKAFENAHFFVPQDKDFIAFEVSSIDYSK